MNNIKLSVEQRFIIDAIIDYINQSTGEKNVATITGSAGTGKSTITKALLDRLDKDNIKYVLAAPTNKAANIFGDMANRDVETIHRLLELSPKLDILKLSQKDIQFLLPTCIPSKEVLIVDECSMVCDELFGYLQEKFPIIIGIGDAKQCAPVKQKELSKFFDHGNVFELTRIFRQSNNHPIMPVLRQLRSNPISTIEPVESKYGNIRVFNDSLDFILSAKSDMINYIKDQNNGSCVIATYTNKSINEYIDAMRVAMLGPKNSKIEYIKNELLTAYISFKIKGTNIRVVNAKDYRIINVSSIRNKVLMTGDAVRVVTLNLQDITKPKIMFNVDLLSMDNSKKTFDSIAKNIEFIRLRAIKAKTQTIRSRLWKTYFAMMDEFQSPIDLVYDGSVVKATSFKHAYAKTCHKLQGDGIDNMYVDFRDILNYNEGESLRQLQYVALSRSKKNINILI